MRRIPSTSVWTSFGVRWTEHQCLPEENISLPHRVRTANCWRRRFVHLFHIVNHISSAKKKNVLCSCQGERIPAHGKRTHHTYPPSQCFVYLILNGVLSMCSIYIGINRLWRRKYGRYEMAMWRLSNKRAIRVDSSSLCVHQTGVSSSTFSLFASDRCLLYESPIGKYLLFIVSPQWVRTVGATWWHRYIDEWRRCSTRRCEDNRTYSSSRQQNTGEIQWHRIAEIRASNHIQPIRATSLFGRNVCYTHKKGDCHWLGSNWVRRNDQRCFAKSGFGCDSAPDLQCIVCTASE